MFFLFKVVENIYSIRKILVEQNQRRQNYTQYSAFFQELLFNVVT